MRNSLLSSMENHAVFDALTDSLQVHYRPHSLACIPEHAYPSVQPRKAPMIRGSTDAMQDEGTVADERVGVGGGGGGGFYCICKPFPLRSCSSLLCLIFQHLSESLQQPSSS